MSAAVLGPTGSLESLTDDLLRSVQSPPKWTLYALAASFVGTLVLFAAVTYTITTGVGTWGNNIPNAWCFGITNFVWWIGIGHAGTFISAFLLLLEQKWRASINRFAEAMTLFAVAQAGLYPLLHLGRPWFFYWLIPYPSTTTAWPQFRSALTWDVVAVSTYLSVSFLFWYLGLIPDLATLRDRAKTLRRRKIYALFALGWTGSSTAWQRWRIGYGLLAGVATPLVVSVHSVVSADFASGNLSGWHSTLFPPFFVAGAIFSGFAMVLTLMIPARKIYKLQHIITARHLDNIAKMLLVTGWIVTYSYAVEIITAWYSKDPFDRYVLLHARLYGVFAPYFWTTVVCNCIAPQILWNKRIRTNPTALFVLSLVIQLGMWMERFLLIVTSQSRDFLPSSWRPFTPSIVDITLLAGTMCFFVFLFTLFLRYIPFVPISEVKHLRHEIEKEGEPAHG